MLQYSDLKMMGLIHIFEMPCVEKLALGEAEIEGWVGRRISVQAMERKKTRKQTEKPENFEVLPSNSRPLQLYYIFQC